MRPECDLLVDAVSFIFLSASPDADRSLKKPTETSLMCPIHAGENRLWDFYSLLR